MILWICGKYLEGEGGKVFWAFQGVFSTKDKAIVACRDRNYFVAPSKLNKELPDDIVTWPGVEYPLIK